MDWAIVVRRPEDHQARGWWVGGDLQDPALDRERFLLLYGELAVLQDQIMGRVLQGTRPKLPDD